MPKLRSIIKTAKTSNLSKYNKHSIASTSTDIHFDIFGELKDVNLRVGRELVYRIVDDIFDKEVGHIQQSSSACAIHEGFKSSEQMDKRLKQWQDTLRDRWQMQRKIYKKTGRKPNEMLFNMPVTVQQHDRGTVEGLMDYAFRMDPDRKQTETGSLPARINQHTCVCAPELMVTLPRTERKGHAVVTISGLTATTKQELTNVDTKRKRARNYGNWTKSKALEDSIERNEKLIKNVIDFFPDVRALEVIGSKFSNDIVEHIENISLVDRESLVSISGSTPACSDSSEELEMSEETQTQNRDSFTTRQYGEAIIKINDEIFSKAQRNSPHVVDLKVYFESLPFQRQMKQVLRLENLGSRLMNFFWMQHETHKRQSILASLYDNLLFNKSAFVLTPGEVRLVKVVFQPRTIGVRKQVWELKIYPNVFCKQRDQVILRLVGKCIPPPEFIRLTDKGMQTVVRHFKTVISTGVVQQQGGLAPVIRPPERTCPYERCLDEREIFNAANPGYCCQRFDDLELLRALYNSIKLPRQPQWDLSLETIKRVILQQPLPERREAIFQEFISLTDLLKCQKDTPFLRSESNTERERSRFIFVRGCISNGIEEWEELMNALEHNALKAELAMFYAQCTEEEDEASSEDNGPKPWLHRLKYVKPELYVLKKLRSKKYYRDSLYIHTYTQLCDLAENIVSIIESTEII